MENRFQDWENNCLKILTSVKKFKDALNKMNTSSTPKIDETTICHYSDTSGQLSTFFSIKDYKEFKLLLKSDSSNLSGCIEKNGSLGKIELQSFRVTIKGLDTDFDYQYQFKKSDWQHIIGLLQNKALASPSNPLQIVDRISSLFKRYIQASSEQKQNFSLDSFIQSKYCVMTDLDAEKLISEYILKIKP